MRIFKCVLGLILLILLWLITGIIGIVGIGGVGYGISRLISGDIEFSLYLIGIALAICGICVVMAIASLSVSKHVKKLIKDKSTTNEENNHL